MKGTVVGLLALGVVAALCAMLLVSAMMAQSSDAAPAAERTEEAEVEVATAGADLGILHHVTQADVVVERVPRSEAPEGAMRPSAVIGRTLSLPMVEGQAFMTRNFAREGPGAHLAASLPDGKRAVSVPLDTYSGMEGLLYPGSVVDVVASLGSRGGPGAASTTLLQGVQVLGVHDRTIVNDDENEGASGGGSGTSTARNARSRVTLMVDPDQLRALQLAMEHGNVTLALRNPGDRSGAAGVTFLSDLTKDQPRLDEEQLATMFRQSQERTLEAVAAMLEQRQTGELPVEQATSRTWEVEVLRGGKMETRRLVHREP